MITIVFTILYTKSSCVININETASTTCVIEFNIMGASSSFQLNVSSGGKNAKASSTSATGRILATWFPLLGWIFAALLFSFEFVYLGTDTNPFCWAGCMASNFSIPATVVASSNLHENHTQDQQHIQQPENSEDQYPLYCRFAYDNDFLSEFHLLDCAIRIDEERKRNATALREKADPSPPRVAFLFVTRGNAPHEPLWRRFFQGHENMYSLYAHTHPDFKYDNTSLFYGHQVPSRTVQRFSINLVDAMRRTLAYSILDPEQGAANSWFVFVCEATIPIRSFNFTYKYLVESEHSFVESFLPVGIYQNWDAKPLLTRNQLRKGELWMALHLRHALMVIEDWSIYYAFKTHCHWWCTPDEEYFQTLLGLKDPIGIENRTVMYVDWDHIHAGSPYSYHAQDMPTEWFRDIQNRTIDKDGEYHDTSFKAKEDSEPVTAKVCYYNGVPNSLCFLFARKINSDATQYLNSLPLDLLGY